MLQEGTHLTKRENENGDKPGAKRSSSEDGGEGVNRHAANTSEWHLDRIKRNKLKGRQEIGREGERGVGVSWSMAKWKGARLCVTQFEMPTVLCKFNKRHHHKRCKALRLKCYFMIVL